MEKPNLDFNRLEALVTPTAKPEARKPQLDFARLEALAGIRPATQQNAPDRPGFTGAIQDVGAGVMQGLQAVPGMALRGYQGVSDMARDFAGVELPGRDWAKDTADKLDVERDYWALSKQAQEKDTFRHALAHGVSSAATSLAPVLALGPLGGAAAGAALLGQAPAYGAAEYANTQDEALRQWKDPQDTKWHALGKAASETGSELLSDFVALGAGKMVAKPFMKAALEKGVSPLLKTTAGNVAKAFGVTVGAEAGSELLNSGVQAEIDKAAGLGNVGFFDAVKRDAGPVVVASVIFGLLGPGFDYARKKSISDALSNPEVDPKARLAAAQELYKDVAKIDQDAARVWSESSLEAIEKGQAIPLDASLLKQPDPVDARVAEIDAQLQQTGDVVEAAKLKVERDSLLRDREIDVQSEDDLDAIPDDVLDRLIQQQQPAQLAFEPADETGQFLKAVGVDASEGVKALKEAGVKGAYVSDNVLHIPAASVEAVQPILQEMSRSTAESAQAIPSFLFSNGAINNDAAREFAQSNGVSLPTVMHIVSAQIRGEQLSLEEAKAKEEIASAERRRRFEEQQTPEYKAAEEQRMLEAEDAKQSELESFAAGVDLNDGDFEDSTSPEIRYRIRDGVLYTLDKNGNESAPFGVARTQDIVVNKKTGKTEKRKIDKHGVAIAAGIKAGTIRRIQNQEVASRVPTEGVPGADSIGVVGDDSGRTPQHGTIQQPGTGESGLESVPGGELETEVTPPFTFEPVGKKGGHVRLLGVDAAEGMKILTEAGLKGFVVKDELRIRADKAEKAIAALEAHKTRTETNELISKLPPKPLALTEGQNFELVPDGFRRDLPVPSTAIPMGEAPKDPDAVLPPEGLTPDDGLRLEPVGTGGKVFRIIRPKTATPGASVQDIFKQLKGAGVTGAFITNGEIRVPARMAERASEVLAGQQKAGSRIQPPPPGGYFPAEGLTSNGNMLEELVSKSSIIAGTDQTGMGPIPMQTPQGKALGSTSQRALPASGATGQQMALPAGPQTPQGPIAAGTEQTGMGPIPMPQMSAGEVQASKHNIDPEKMTNQYYKAWADKTKGNAESFSDWIRQQHKNFAEETFHTRSSLGDKYDANFIPWLNGETQGQGSKWTAASPADVPYDLAYQAHAGTSHSPEDRARSVQRDYANTMQSIYDDLKQTAANQEELDAEFKEFKAGFLSRLKAALAADAQTMSILVAGRSNFNTRKNGKKVETARKRWDELAAYEKKAVYRIKEKLAPAVPRNQTDPKAELEKRIADKEKLQEQMKKINAEFRKHKGDIDKMDVPESVKASVRKWDEARKTDTYLGNLPVASYQLTNNSAEIRRLKTRLAGMVEENTAETTTSAENVEVKFDGGTLVENFTDDRVQLFFDGKPSVETRNQLKAHGFKWAPSVGAWQRKLTTDAKFWAEKISGAPVAATLPATTPVVDSETAVDSQQADDGEGRAMFSRAAPKRVSQLGFYSAAREAVDEMDFKAAPAKDILARIKKTQGLKQEELDDLGLFDWLEGVEGKVSKEQVLSFIDNNGPQLEEVRDEKKLYSKYQLPGNKNYRAVLFTISHEKRRHEYDSFLDEMKNKYGEDLYIKMTDAEYGKLNGLLEEKFAANEEVFNSSHWRGTKNVIAHARIADHDARNGDKVLLVEEIQSDWHQAGRDKGYKGITQIEVPTNLRVTNGGPEAGFYEVSDADGNFVTNVTSYDLLENTIESALQEANRRVREDRNRTVLGQRDRSLVPNAPFKSTPAWSMLAFKRMLKEAVDGGYDRIAWTPGIEQVKRYEDSMRKAVDKIEWTKNADGSVSFNAVKAGKTVYTDTKKAEGVAEVIGKGSAQHIADSSEQSGVLQGKDLTIGGEGMKGFYDKILPAEVKKYLQKMDKTAKVEVIKLKNRKEVWSVAITDAMREQVAKGQPLYKKGKASVSGVKASDVKTALATLQAKAKNALPTEVVQRQEDLPKHILTKNDKDGGGSISGVYDPKTGKVFLVADNLPSVDAAPGEWIIQAAKTWQHEQGHANIKDFFYQTFGESWGKKFDAFLNQIHALYSGKPEMAEVRKLYPKAKQKELAEELFMRHVFEQVKAGKPQGKAKILWSRFLEIVKGLLNYFAPAQKRAQAEIERVARGLAEFIQSGRGAGFALAGSAKFSFAGPKAKGADTGLLAKAQRMQESGASREDIWKETGWWEIMPGQWSFEINDKFANFNSEKMIQAKKEPNGMQFMLPDLMKHDRIFDAYPWLKDFKVVIKDIGNEWGGLFHGLKAPLGKWHISVSKDSPIDYMRGTILHEIQHAIQRKEGFATGGGPDLFKYRGPSVAYFSDAIEEIEKLQNILIKNKKPTFADISLVAKDSGEAHAIWGWYDLFRDYDGGVFAASESRINDLKTQMDKAVAAEITDTEAYQKYMKLTGEAEARLVRKRMDMGVFDRQKQPPWVTLENMLRDEGLLQEGQKPEDVLISRKDDDAASADIRYSRSAPVSAITDAEAASRFGHVNPRLKAAGKSPGLPSLWERSKTALDNAVKSFTRHFIHLDPKTDGAVMNVLRENQEVASWAWERAGYVAVKHIKDLSPNERDVFTYNLVLADMLRDIDDGLLDGESELPFGYKNREEAQADLDHFKALADRTPAIKKALKERGEFMTKLRKDLVKHKLLDKAVLDQDANAYFHHQVLEYMTLKNGPGTSSQDLRTHKKGWQLGRKGSVKDYSTNYLEAELAVIAQGLAQVKTAQNMDRVQKLTDVKKDLEQDAKAANKEAMDKKIPNSTEWKAAYPEWEAPYRSGIAAGFSALGKMAYNHDFAAVPSEFSEIVDGLAESHESKKDDSAEQTLIVNSPRMFQFLTWLINNHPGKASSAAAKIFKNIKARNTFIKETLGKDFKTFRDFVPEGYTAWKPKPGGTFYHANAMTDKVIEGLLQGTRTLQETDVQNVLAKAPDAIWIIPERVAQTLDELKPARDNSMLGQVSQTLLAKWKQWILINPLRVIKYNLNNMSGDLDICLAYDPKIITQYSRQALQDLWKAYGKGHWKISDALRAELDEARERGVISSGMTSMDIPDPGIINQADKFLRTLDGKNRGVMDKFAQFWETTKGLTTLRENVMRLAAYRYFKSQVEKGAVYAASNKAEVDAIADRGERAAKLARELVGDYGNVSHSGQWIRQHMIPFWSWCEVNAPRYVRLFRNLKHEGKDAQAMSSVMAWKATKLGLKAGALYGLISLWNAVMFPDEDDELKEAQRQQLHLILGRRDDGTIITFRFQGALSDALSWVGLQNPVAKAKGIAEGGWHDEIVASIKAGPNKLAQGIRPEPKLFFESATGKTLYPDVFNSRPIRDRVENVLRTFSLDKIWNAASGKPRKGGSWETAFLSDIGSMFVQTTDAGEAAYWRAKKGVFKWEEANGKEAPSITPTNKANALYYYRQALKFGDLQAAARYYEKYRELGGKQEGIAASVKRAHPLGSIPLAQRARYRASLTPQERQTLDTAIDWWKRTYVGGHAEARKAMAGNS